MIDHAWSLKINTYRGVIENMARITLIRYHRLDSLHDIDDIVQEVIINASLNKLIDCERIMGWLNRITINQVISYLRKKKNTYDISDVKEEASCIAAETEYFKSVSAGELRRNIMNLSKNQRECLILWSRGFRYDEISTSLNINLSSVKSFIFRGRKELRLQEEQEVS
jgi:RNA polymerase sigma-70 factor (ECF subfamily)